MHKMKTVYVLIVFLFFIAANVLFLLLRPAPTVASLLKLDSKEQIVSIKIGENVLIDQLYDMEAKERLDITQTALGERYIEALFLESIEFCDDEMYVKSDYIPGMVCFGERVIIEVKKELWNDSYTYVFFIDPCRHGMPITQVEIGEETITFILPDNEIFSSDFINSFFE